MPPSRLKSIVPETYTACDTGIEFSAIDASLEQQVLQPFITVLPQWGVLTVEGPDAATFLQGQLSCDLNGVTPELACRGIHATPKGRAIAGFQLLQCGEHRYDCLLPLSALPLLQQSLAKYIVFSKAELADNSEHRVVMTLSGAGSESLVAQYFAKAPMVTHQQVNASGANCTRLEGDTPRFRLVLDAQAAGEFWRLSTAMLSPAHSAASLLQDIRAGVATIEAATSEAFIPQMLNYDLLGAVSFNKGCYTGQEVIARAHYRGAVKRRMRGFTSTTSHCPRPGSEVFVDGKSCGRVVNAVASNSNRIEGLVVVAEDLAGEIRFDPEHDASLILIPLDYHD